eukprot:CAMPEP_0115858586 /NCGR_PEP_ID=MMETSP0287-20121206/16175_1 /TAXON_ID=412157 /ORGANISM="Chrysochromulina rotalis, Strain UIO044" /LENGTH=80 /DNA_ID=CAMNT_0003312857 /DNA_START=584 /DNA_END=823 /DNA_ORIENTATION=-
MTSLLSRLSLLIAPDSKPVLDCCCGSAAASTYVWSCGCASSGGEGGRLGGAAPVGALIRVASIVVEGKGIAFLVQDGDMA